MLASAACTELHSDDNGEKDAATAGQSGSGLPGGGGLGAGGSLARGGNGGGQVSGGSGASGSDAPAGAGGASAGEGAGGDAGTAGSGGTTAAGTGGGDSGSGGAGGSAGTAGGGSGGSAGSSACPGATAVNCYPDGDHDGYAAASAALQVQCDACATGYTSRAPAGADVDCDDAKVAVLPGATESCNGVNDDCDAQTDEGTASMCTYDHGTGACTSGACELASCASGYDDCDTTASTGCEQALNVNAHCGSCSNACKTDAGCVTKSGSSSCLCNAGKVGDPSACKGYGPLAVSLNLSCGIASGGAISCFPGPGSPAPTLPSGSFKQIGNAPFSSHMCAIKASDGTITCWGGSNSDGERDAPTGAFVQVVTGAHHTCGLRADGTVECWGVSQKNPGTTTDYSQSIAPTEKLRHISAGRSHNCGLRDDGTVLCWGAGATRTNCPTTDNCGQSAVPAGEHFVQVSAGGLHTCGLRANGTVLCWGAGTSDPNTSPDFGQSTPPTLASGKTFTFISAGFNNTCAVVSDQSLRCWGAGDFDGASVPDHWRQSLAPSTGSYLRVYAGLTNSCALNTATSMVCWGDGKASSNPGSFPLNP